MSTFDWDSFEIGKPLQALHYPLTVYRLIMAAGANRDFNAIHHNAEFARASGAPDIYGNNILLQGMWEKFVRHHVGLAGRILQLNNFKMRSFNCPGDTLVVHGSVLRKWRGPDAGFLEIKVWSENRNGIAVGPGSVIVSMPTV